LVHLWFRSEIVANVRSIVLSAAGHSQFSEPCDSRRDQ
jgi:hypothetical protein